MIVCGSCGHGGPRLYSLRYGQMVDFYPLRRH